MTSMIKAVGSFLFPAKEITTSICNATLEELEVKVDEQGQQRIVEDYSLLRKSPPPINSKEFTSPYEEIRAIAEEFQNENVESGLSKNCTQFLKEFSSLKDHHDEEVHLHFLENLENEEKSKEALQKYLDAQINKYKKSSKHQPIWISVSDTIYVWIDCENGILTVLNNDPKAQNYNESLEEHDPTGKGSNFAVKRKLISHYLFDPERNRSDRDIFIGLSRMSLEPDKMKFFYDNFIPFAGLLRAKAEDDKQLYIREGESTLQALLYYAVKGAFTGDLEQKQCGLCFRKFLYNRQLNAIVFQAIHAKSTQDWQKCKAQLERLIIEARDLQASKTLSETEVKTLHATYHDVVQRNDGVEAEQKKSPFINLSQHFNCTVKKNNSTFSLISNTTLRNVCPVNPKLHGYKTKNRELSLSPRSLETQNAIKLLIDWGVDRNDAASLDVLADELLKMANACLEPPLERIEEQQQNTHDQLKSFFCKIIVEIPIPNTDPDNFWNNLQNPSEYLRSLNKLSDALHKFLNVYPNNLKIQGADFVNTREASLNSKKDSSDSSNSYNDSILIEGMILNYQILASIDYLSRKNADAKLNGFNTYHYEFQKLLSNPQCVIEDERVQSIAFDIARYFNPACFKHEIVLGTSWSKEECAQEVQKGIFAFLSVSIKKVFFKNETEIYPLAWQPDSLENECLDSKGQTYAYFKQFINEHRIIQAWESLGNEAPKTQNEKIMWLAADSLKEDSLLPLEVCVLQKAAMRSIGLNYINLGLRDIEVSLTIPGIARKDRPFFWRMERNPFKSSRKSSLSSPNQNKIIKDYASLSDIAYFQVWANPLDCINRWVNLLYSNIMLLENITFRREFFDACFQFGRLELQLFCQPRFAFRLKEWLQNAIYFALSHSDYGLLEELCEFTDKLARFIRSIKLAEEFQFDDVVQWLKTKIYPLCNAPEDKYWLHLNILKLLPNTGTVNVRETLISSAIVLFTKKYIRLEDQADIHQIANCFQSLFSAKRNDFGVEVFNAVANIYNIPNVTEAVVEYNKIQGGGYEIDLVTFEVRMNGVPLMHRIPAEVLNRKNFKHYYGIELDNFIHEDYFNDYDISIEDNYYVLTPKKDRVGLESYRIGSFKFDAKSLERAPILEKRINGKLYEMMALNEFKLFKPDHVWIEDYKDIIWQEKNGFHVIVENNSKVKAELVCEVSSKYNAKLVPFKIVVNDRELISADRVSKGILNALGTINRVSSIQFWKDTNHDRLQRIVLPDCNLSFTVDDQDRLSCDQYHGYYLIKKSSECKASLVNSNSIVLVNQDNQYKEVSVDYTNGLTLLEYDHEDNRIIPKGNSSVLVLISKYVSEPLPLYGKASNAVNELSGLFDLSAFENGQLRSLLENLKKDGSFQAVAIDLKLSLFLYEQEVLHNDKKFDVQILLEKYLDFLRVRDLCFDCELSTREEIRLLEILITYYDEKLEERITPSIANYWGYYIDSRRRDFLKNRLNFLTDKGPIYSHSLPLLREVPNSVIPDIPTSALWANLSDLSKRITNELHAQKKSNPLAWQAPDSIKKEIELTSGLFNIKRPISASTPPTLRDLTQNFFIYYRFICEEATEDERGLFARSLLLIPDPTGVVAALRRICIAPHGRVSVESLLSLHRSINPTGFFFDWVKASLKQVELQFRLWGIVRFQWIRFISSWMDYNLNKIRLFADAIFKASINKIILNRPVFKQQIKDCSAIDKVFNKDFLDLVLKHFKVDKNNFLPVADTSLKYLSEDVDVLINENTKLLKIEMQRLILLSNASYGSGFIAALMRQIQGRRLDEKSLFAAFASRSEAKIMALTSFTDVNDFNNFLVCLTIHYQKTTRLHQLQRTSKRIKEALNSEGVVREKLCHDALSILTTLPTYSRDTSLQSRIKLAQEVQLGFMASGKQSLLLNSALAKLENDVIIKAPPGSGKSSYIRNALSLLLTASGQNVVNIMPSMQEPTLARELDEFLRPLGKHVVRLNLSRKSEFSLQKLEHILRIIRSSERDIDVSTPETYQWLEVHMKLHCYRLTKMNPSFIPQDELKKLQLFLMILREHKVNSRALFEEAQVTLKREDRVEIADGSCRYNPRYANIARQMMNFIMKVPEYADVIFANTQENLIRDKNKLKALKLHVAECFSKKWKIPLEDNKKFMDFVLCTENDADFLEAYKWAENRSHDRDKLAQLKGFLNIALPQACKERIDIINGYRLSILTNYGVPIPCIEKGNPKESNKGPSNYYHDVALLRGFLFYLAVKPTMANTITYIRQVYGVAEMQANGNCSIDNTPAGKQFYHLVKKLGLPLDKFSLSSMQGSNEIALAEALIRSSYGINLFVQMVIACQIEIYTTTIEASTVSLQNMFNTTVALSADPPSKMAYSPNAVVVEDDTAEAFMEDLLLNKTSLDNRGGEARFQVLEGENLEEVLEDCARKIAINKATAIVEATPLFNTKKNKDVAALFGEFLKHFNVYEGVLFCDEGDKLNKVYDIKTKTVQPLTVAYKQENLFKLYTEAEAFNVDWFSIGTGLFEIIIGPKTKWGDAAQAAGRARLSRILQSFCFMMDKELRKEFPKNVTSKDIVEFLKRNTKLFVELNTFVSLNDQINNTPHRYLLNMMLGLSSNKKYWKKDLEKLPNPVKALELFRQNPKVFLKYNNPDAWKNYSSFKTNLPAEKQLKEIITHNVHMVRGMNGPNFLDRWRMEWSLNDHEKRLKDNAEEVSLPATVNGFENRINSHIEVMRIPQDERQIKMADTVVFSRQEFHSDKYPSSLQAFIEGGYKPSKARHAIYKTVIFAKKCFYHLANQTSRHIPFVFMGGFTGFAGSFLITNAVLATNIALASLVGMITMIAANFIFYCATFLLHLSEWAVTKVNVTYDTHYLKDIVSMYLEGKNKDVVKIFANSNVMVTNNKFKLWTGNFANTSQIPFMPDAKELLQILVIYHKKTETFELIDIDIEDSRQIYAMLINDQLHTSKEEAEQWGYEVAIYDVQAEFASQKSFEDRFVITSKGGIHTEQLLKNEKFHQDINLIKFWNGYTSFTETQKQAVTALTDRIGNDALVNAETLEDFYLNNALLHKPSRNGYSTLEIASVINPYSQT